MTGPSLAVRLIWLAPVLLVAACSDAQHEPPRVKSDHTWSDQQEVIYQLREVIRYEDDQERQRRQELELLALPAGARPPETGMPAGEGQNQGQQ